ncbi:MAG: hypothetical protein ACRD4X_19015 [Candidatus Acidiferrales bacterium]
MFRSKPHQVRWIWIALIAAALGSGEQSARAQRRAGHSATAAHPIFRTYAPRPQLARPISPRVMPARAVRLAYPRTVPIRRPVIGQLPPSMRMGTYAVPRTLAPYSRILQAYAQPGFTQLGLRGAAFQPRTSWRGLGPRGYFNSFLFGGAYVNDFGYWEAPANYQMLPLGFGLWPACDSAAIPGRFWTIGPCAGIGDYQAVTPATENEYAPQQYFQTPIEIIEEPQPVAPPSTQKPPAAPAQKQNMLVCLTNGLNTEVSDWWVAEGRFYFIPMRGKAESVDLGTLDLQKTIEENEKRGRTFILNFTPPSERPVLPELPPGPQK